MTPLPGFSGSQAFCSLENPLLVHMGASFYHVAVGTKQLISILWESFSPQTVVELRTVGPGLPLFKTVIMDMVYTQHVCVGYTTFWVGTFATICVYDFLSQSQIGTVFPRGSHPDALLLIIKAHRTMLLARAVVCPRAANTLAGGLSRCKTGALLICFFLSTFGAFGFREPVVNTAALQTAAGFFPAIDG